MKRSALLFFLYITFANFSSSQSSLPKNTTDSLWNVWSNPDLPDTSRLIALDELAWYGYLYTQPDSCFYFSQLQYEFASVKNLKKYMAAANNMQGISHYLRGQYAQAIYYHEKSLKLQEETGNQQGVAASLNNIGIVFLFQGEYDKAHDVYSRSLKIGQETGDLQGVANTLNNIGIIYVYQGDYPKAIAYYRQSLNLEKELGSQQGIANSLNCLGMAYSAQGDYLRALDYYLQGLEIQARLSDVQAHASMLNNVGMIFSEQHDDSIAINYYQQSFALQEMIGDQYGASASLFNIGKIYFENADYDMALNKYALSLKIREQIGDRQGIAITLTGFAMIHNKLGNPQKAIPPAHRALELATAMNIPGQVKNASRALFESYWLVAQPDSAFFYLTLLKNTIQQELALNYFSLSQREKELYFSIMEEDYGRYYDFTLDFQEDFPGLSDTAYNLALANKGLSLKSSTAMRESILGSGDTALIGNYENWLTLKKKSGRLYQNGEDTKVLEHQVNELEKELVEKSAAFSDFNKVKNLDWKQVQDALQPGECAIEFVNFKRSTHLLRPVVYAALLVTPGSKHPQMISLCYESELAEILGTFQGNNLPFVSAVYGTMAEARDALYKKIWLPLESSLDGMTTIYYSPSGLLHKISFSTISVPGGSSGENVFLCDQYNFRQMGSTGKVTMPDNETIVANESFFLMGGVAYNSDKPNKEVWSYLPGSLKETEAISTTVSHKGFRVNYFSGDNASEENFKKNSVGSAIIHIATHGFFFPDPEQVHKEMFSSSESSGDIEFRGQHPVATGSDDLSQPKKSTQYATWSFVNNKNPLMRSGIVLAHANDVWTRDPLSDGEDGILTAQEVSNLDLSNTKLVVLSACETGLGDIKGSEGVYGLQRAFKMAGVKYMIMSLWQVPDKETAEFMQLFYKNLLKLKHIPLAFQKTQKVMREKYDPYYWGAFVLIE